MSTITLTISMNDPNLSAVLTLLGMLPTPAAPSQAPMPAGSYIDATGLAVLDADGAAIVADPHNASQPYLMGLRLLASKTGVLVTELMQAVGAATPEKLAGHKAATTKRVKTALGGKSGAVLFRVEKDKVVVADLTRQALAAHFGLPVT